MTLIWVATKAETVDVELKTGEREQKQRDAFVPERFLHRRRDSAPSESCEAVEAGVPQTEPGASGKTFVDHAWEQDSIQHLLVGKCPYFNEL